MILVENRRATGVDTLDKETDVEVSREVLSEMQEWVETRDFDGDDLFDISRSTEISQYVLIRERARGHKDTVSVQTDEYYAALSVPDFLEL